MWVMTRVHQAAQSSRCNRGFTVDRPRILTTPFPVMRLVDYRQTDETFLLIVNVVNELM